ncbi:unnamed protein product, partial [Larinioides sclopetarius]
FFFYRGQIRQTTSSFSLPFVFLTSNGKDAFFLPFSDSVMF